MLIINGYIKIMVCSVDCFYTLSKQEIIAVRFTKHAIKRCNTRGIPKVMIDILLNYGSPEYHKGNEILRLDKRGLRSAEQYLGSFYQGSKQALKEIYIVINDDVIVTAARKQTHHKRNR